MRECNGPIMDHHTGVLECPDGRHEPSEEDCDRCQALADDHADSLREALEEMKLYGRQW